MSGDVPFFYDTKKKSVTELVDGMVVGRNKDCDISVVDHRVSGMHFKVSIKANEVYVTDLESSNKTKLNGEVLEAKIETKISIKDHLKFGDQKFIFFYEAIDDFSVPEVTSTLQISSTADCADDLFKSSSLEVVGGVSLGGQKKTKVSELKSAKAKIDELEKQMALLVEEGDDLNSLKKSYDELTDKILNSKEQLSIAKYDNKEVIEKDLQNFEFSISELNESINEAKQKIESWNKQIAIINQSILQTKHLHIVFDDLKSFEEQEKELKAEIDSKNSMSIEQKKEAIKNEYEQAKENYKKLQENYSLALGGPKKNKAA